MASRRSTEPAERSLLPTSTELAENYSLFGSGAPHRIDQSNGAASCSCDRCERWSTYIKTGGSGKHQPLYLVPTSDLIARLATWLINTLGSSDDATILEIGAGDGALAMHLKNALNNKKASNNIRVIASDSGARGLSPVAPVEQLDVAAALAAHNPRIVLCAFMPLGVDFTAAIRQCESVEAYLLLGEIDNGCCGRPWLTWGYLCDGDDDAGALSVSSTSGESSSEDGDDDDAAAAERTTRPSKSRRLHADPDAWRKVYIHEPQRTPFGADGWVRKELKELSDCCICRTDSCWDSTRHAKAVLFSRSRREEGWPHLKI